MKAHLHLLWPLLLLALMVAGAGSAAAEDGDKGVWISRSDGGNLNLLIAEESFELHFYDEDGEAVPPDAAQAILHCTSRVVRSRETLALLPVEKEETTILSSPRLIKPPYQFDILLVLNFDDEEKEPESYHLVFIQND